MDLDAAADVVVAVLGLVGAVLSFLETRHRHHDRQTGDRTAPHRDESAGESDTAGGDAPGGPDGRQHDAI